jgi:hypothetical protein
MNTECKYSPLDRKKKLLLLLLLGISGHQSRKLSKKIPKLKRGCDFTRRKRNHHVGGWKEASDGPASTVYFPQRNWIVRESFQQRLRIPFWQSSWKAVVLPFVYSVSWIAPRHDVCAGLPLLHRIARCAKPVTTTATTYYRCYRPRPIPRESAGSGSLVPD